MKCPKCKEEVISVIIGKESYCRKCFEKEIIQDYVNKYFTNNKFEGITCELKYENEQIYSWETYFTKAKGCGCCYDNHNIFVPLRLEEVKILFDIENRTKKMIERLGHKYE